MMFDHPAAGLAFSWFYTFFIHYSNLLKPSHRRLDDVYLAMDTQILIDLQKGTTMQTANSDTLLSLNISPDGHDES